MNITKETRPTVLIVDDEEDLRALVSDMIDECGFSVLTAENGVEALAVLKKEKVSTIVSDLNMPKMDGLKLLAEVKILQPTLPFIILTAFWSKDASLSALRLGAFDFLEKPFTTTGLQAVVKKAVALRMAQEASMTELLRKQAELGKPVAEDDAKNLEALADMIAKRQLAS